MTTRTYRWASGERINAVKLDAAFDEAVNIAAARSAVLTRNPLVSDDSAAGYGVFSRIGNTNTRREWACVDPAAGAARWLPVAWALNTAYRSGRWYGRRGLHSAANLVPAVDTLYVYPIGVRERVQIDQIGFRNFTAGVGSSVKMALYLPGANGMPTGAPLVSDPTGLATTSGPADVVMPVTATLQPPYVWAAQVHTGSTLPIAISRGTTFYDMEDDLGRATLASNTALAGLSRAQTFSASWPTFTGSETWDDVVVPGIPMMLFRAV